MFILLDKYTENPTQYKHIDDILAYLTGCHDTYLVHADVVKRKELWKIWLERWLIIHVSPGNYVESYRLEDGWDGLRPTISIMCNEQLEDAEDETDRLYAISEEE